MFTDGIDSYYQYVKARVNAFTTRTVYNSPNQRLTGVVKGMLSAQDWPSKDVVMDAFYLLDLGEAPIGKQGYSAAVPIKFHQVQWVWLNQGTYLTQGIRQGNRADRYRTMQIMKGELTNGHFPGYCPKLTWALVDGVWTGTALIPAEVITWNPIEFHEKWSAVPDGAGVGYGSGAVRVADMLDVITA
jgi:hypothetical protein